MPDPTGAQSTEEPAQAIKPSPEGTAQRPQPRKVAALLYVLCTVVYGLFAGDRLLTHSPDNHFAYLADAYLHGTLAVRCTPAETSRNSCPPGGGGNDWAKYQNRWYVAFPSFPAVLYMPAVAVAGRDFRNRLYDIFFAGLAPPLFYLLLERLSKEGRSQRNWKENLSFACLLAFGTVYFFSVVQGSVWFTAHMVAVNLLVGYLWFALDARNPFIAGVFLGIALHTRADLAYAAPLFAVEVLRVSTKPGHADEPNSLKAWLRSRAWSDVIRKLVLFGLPVALAVGLSLYLNKLRFDDWSEVGYRYLQIRWKERIERWGLFNYHYLSRNLAIALTSLPWIQRGFPYVIVSLHGLALWFTTPHYLELLRLRRRSGDVYFHFLLASGLAVALAVLMYQNSGWVQFGFRFSNDFALFFLLLLALNGKPLGRVWYAALVVAVLVNVFGALTFDRQFKVRDQSFGFYDNDGSQQRYFQPD